MKCNGQRDDEYLRLTLRILFTTADLSYNIIVPSSLLVLEEEITPPSRERLFFFFCSLGFKIIIH